MGTAVLDRPAPIRDDATRRQFLIGGAALTALLAGCGSDAEPSPDAPADDGRFPRTLVGKEGTATIPAEPQRVVTVGFQRDTDTVLALGVTPIAMVRHDQFESGSAPWVEAALVGATPQLLAGAAGLPFEQIAALRPDLIVATDDYELTTNYARLTQIAPTVSYLGGVESDTWQQRTTHIGAALGRDEQAQQLVTDTQLLVTQAAMANPAFAGKTFSRFYAYEGEIRAITGADASVTLLEDLGFKVAPEVAALPQNDTPGRASVSLENLSVLDTADLMLVSYPSPADRTFIESSPLFPQLNAVKNGTYVVFEQSVALALGFPSALSIPYGLDRMVAAIADALT
ncbi:MAG: iron-siderophore ABC transporter substrate-binding protein [Pseudonocardiales bacterium]